MKFIKHILICLILMGALPVSEVGFFQSELLAQEKKKKKKKKKSSSSKKSSKKKGLLIVIS